METGTLVFLLIMLGFLVIIGVSLIYVRYCSARRKKKSERNLEDMQFDYHVVDVNSVIDENWTCSVCLNGLKECDVVVQTRCNHQFHQICLDQWLINAKLAPSCPTCRSTVEFTHRNQISQNINDTSIFVDHIGNNDQNLDRLHVIPL